MLKGSKTAVTLSVSARSYAPASKNGGGGGGKESFELQGIGVKPKLAISSGETIVDDMKYRRSARVIAAADITYSTLMLAVQLLGLTLGAAHSVNAKLAQPTVSSSRHFGLRPPPTEPPTLSPKLRETIAVLVWTALFTVCVAQLIVAGALYGGTNERDGRKCIRNCRIWCITTVFISGVLCCQIIFLLFVLQLHKHIWMLIILSGELSFRLIALFFIRKFIAELVIEFCDDDNPNDHHVQYEPLIPSPVPILKNANHV